jgi:hypothetical protein
MILAIITGSYLTGGLRHAPKQTTAPADLLSSAAEIGIQVLSSSQ